MTITPALDRGYVDSLPELRPNFSVADLDNWRAFIVTEEGQLGIHPAGTHLQSVAKDFDDNQPWLLGRTADGVTHCVWMINQEKANQIEDLVFRPITEIGAFLSEDEALLGAQAVALARWHSLDRYCARCGGMVEASEAGWASECQKCGRIEYPRMDPAVIVFITDENDRVLLAHNTLWQNNMMSLPAGFVEAGETPRRAVKREILEEIGIKVDQIKFLAAQPWPGPRSLMLAFSARALPGQIPQPDEEEIDYAQFFSRDEYLEAIASGKIRAPRETAIANTILSEWVGQQL